ncbi:MAG: hypothetical protein LC808_27805, partial [Actinobacteria bacterium]|nr:hypothetical protein [Actinomycetota bacterium]
MVGVVFVRRLREGKTYEDFRDAWYPEVGFGVPSRVLSGPNIFEPREIVTVGFVNADVNDLQSLGAQLAAQEAKRHDRIAEVIEHTELRTFFTIEDDSDFSGRPRA